MIFLGFYLLFFILALLLAVLVYRRLRGRGLLIAVGGSLLTLLTLALFFPLPIHGGFTFPLEIALQELKREQWKHEATRKDEKRHAFEESLQKRFLGVIENYTVQGEEGEWQRVSVNNTTQALLDTRSGLLWLPPQTMTTQENSISLNVAYAFCQEQAPQGYWALPSEAELALLWQHGGHHLMPATGQSSLALLSDETLQQHMATYYRGRIAGYSLRCVALTEKAPRLGYMSNDIPLSLWNNYQLHKSDIYTKDMASDGAAFNQEIK